LISLNLLKLRSAVLRTVMIGKLSLEWPQAPFLWDSGGKRRHFAYTFQAADGAMQTDVYKAIYPFYAKRNCSILRQRSQKFASLAAVARFIAISSKIDYRQILSKVLFYKEANKTTIMSLFCLARLASIT